MISWRIAAKRRHTLLHELTGFMIHGVVILVIKKTAKMGKRPVDKLLLHPIVTLGIFPLETHIHRQWLIAHGHGQRHHDAVIPHAHTPDINGIQDNPLILRQRVVDIWLRCFCWGQVRRTICRCFPVIFAISHPVGTGALKQVFHMLTSASNPLRHIWIKAPVLSPCRCP